MPAATLRYSCTTSLLQTAALRSCHAARSLLDLSLRVLLPFLHSGPLLCLTCWTWGMYRETASDDASSMRFHIESGPHLNLWTFDGLSRSRPHQQGDGAQGSFRSSTRQQPCLVLFPSCSEGVKKVARLILKRSRFPRHIVDTHKELDVLVSLPIDVTTGVQSKRFRTRARPSAVEAISHAREADASAAAWAMSLPVCAPSFSKF